MKKGFTLIELLAVILILGIIALIAIPTVNKIINEARYGAFKSGNDNIMKTIEQDCQTSIMKGENPILSYIFTEGKSNFEINVKGSLPTDGYIILDKNCSITDYYLSDNKNVYSNGEDIRQNNMIMLSTTGQSIFQDIYPTYYNNIKNITFLNHLNISNSAIEIKDISISQNEKIKSWLIPNEDKYDLYIGSETKIFANINSSYLFNNMSLVEKINFDNFDTSFVDNMSYFFNNCISLSSLDVSSFKTDNVITIFGMFYGCNNLQTINLLNWNTPKLIDMTYLFAHCYMLENIQGINHLNTQNVTSMHQIFLYNKLIKTLDLSNWDTGNVLNMHGIFQLCHSLEKIYGIENWNTSKVYTIAYLFNCCSSLKSIDISSWDLSQVNDVTGILELANVEELKLNKGSDLNLLIDEIPTKDINKPGIITIKTNKNDANIDALLAKNWNVV